MSQYKQPARMQTLTEREEHYLRKLPVYRILTEADLNDESVRKSSGLASRLREAGMSNTNLENYWRRVSFIAENCKGRVLELGCGCGNITRYISRNPCVTHICAVDAQSAYIDQLRAYSFDKVEAVCADVLTHKFSGKFDCAVIAEFIEHVTLAQERQFIRKLGVVIEPGTILIITTPIGFMPDPDHVRGFSTSEFHEHIEQYYGKMVKTADNGIQQFAVVIFHPSPAQQPQAHVSVVLPTYNHLQLLPNAAESVFAQTYDDFELIIVNDGSTDGTREYLNSLKDPRVRVIHQENKRLPEALNTGFRAARGELLTWISADNYCVPVFLEKFVAAMKANPEAAFAYSAFVRIDERDRFLGVTRCPDLDYKKLLLNFPGMASFMYRRRCQQEVGLYDPSLEGAEDWDMWLRIAERFPLLYVPDVLYYYRRHDQSLTATKSDLILNSSLQAFENALGRLRLQDLYPRLGHSHDHSSAEFDALLDFGTSVLRSKFRAHTDAACRFLSKALSLQPDSIEAAGNLAVAYALRREWEKVLPLAKRITKEARNPTAQSICCSVLQAYKTNEPQALSSVPLFEVDKNSSELFKTAPAAAPHGSSEPSVSTKTLALESEYERDTVDTAPDCFLRAVEELDKGNFEAAAEYMQKYTTTVDYSKFPRTIFTSRQNEKIDISVIVVTYNRSEDLVRCLESLSKQDAACSYEVIVVDNGTGGVEGLRQYADQYIKCPVNLVLSEGRNVGACCAKGAIVAFLDDDAIVPSDYISSIKTAFETFDIFGLRGKALPKTNPAANKDATGYDRGDKPFVTFCDLEGNSAFLRDIYLSLNGMDPLLFGHEGSDLTCRITEKYDALNKIIYWPNTVIYHDAAVGDQHNRKVRRYELLKRYLEYKHNRNIFVLRGTIEKQALPAKTPHAQTLFPQRKKYTIEESDPADIPVVLVTYNRPKHTLEVLKALRNLRAKKLYIFSDAPKRPEDAQAVSLVRRLVHSVDWTRPEIVERTENVGLAANIVSAVDSVLERYDRLILLEDDCVPQPYFFDFMDACLRNYENDPKVFGISGHTVALSEDILRDYPYDAYFSPRIGSWGWATWKRAWLQHFRDLSKLVETANQRNIDLTQGGADIPISVQNFLNGKLTDVWTLNWVLSVYINDGVYVYPTSSHIRNIGTDGTGLHCGKTDKYDSPCSQTKPERYPADVFLDDRIMQNFRQYFQAAPERTSQAVSFLRSLRPEGPLKIAQINTVDNRGGAAKVAWMLKQGLTARGHHLKMFVKNKFSNDPDVTVIANPAVDAGNERTDQGLLYYDIDSTRLLSRNAEFTSADIFHFHNLHGAYFNPLALPDLTRIRPSVWTLHDMQSLTGHCAHSFDCDKWKTGCGDCPDLSIYPALPKDNTARLWKDKKQIYESADVTVVVPSQWLKSRVSQSILKNKRLELIHNGVDTGVFHPYPRDAARRQLRLPVEATILAFAAQGGVNSPWRDANCLAAAIQHLGRSPGPVYFLSIGSGKRISQTGNVIHVPYVSDEKTLALIYSAADLFLFPSLADNCPLVVIESMACGLPVIAYNTGGLPEIIENGRTGVITEYRNTGEFAKAAEHLAFDHAKRQQYAGAGIERARRLFSLDLMLDRYLALYRELAGNAREKSYTSSGDKVAFSQVSAEKENDYIVSAVVSTYNSEKFIRGCLQDLENQTIADRLEIIVVNSGSQQNEEAVVREFQSRYENIKYIKTQERETIYSAWNRAVKASSGRYITTANTDDRHTGDAFEKMANALDANPDKVLVYADQIDVSETDGQRIEVGKRVNGPFSRDRLFRGECPPGSQPMWRADVHNRVGYFDEAFAVSGDYEFWFRLTQKYDFLYLNEFLGERLVHPQAVSRTNSDLLNWENMVIDKCYRYALHHKMDITAAGLSNHPDFRDWPEVNIWRQRVTAKLNGSQVSLGENVKNLWDCRTSPAPKLTVVLVTYNRERELFQALDSLNRQTEKDFELIVVANDGDLSGLKQKTKDFDFGLCGIELEHNYGPSPARNKASEFAKAPYIAFIDDDAVADENMVRNIISHFKNTRASGLRGKVLPKTKDGPRHAPANYDLGDEVIPTACEVSSLSAYRRDVFAEAGGFDELLFGPEGADLSYRICKTRTEKTRSVLYFPDVIVYHDPRPAGPTQTEKTLRRQWMDLLAWRKDPDIRGYRELVRSLYPAGCDPAVQNNYAWIVNVAMCLEKNFPQDAINWARKANALRPNGVRGCYVLGGLCVRLGQYDQARVVLERIVKPLQQALADGGSQLLGAEFQSRDEIAECYLKTCTQLAQCCLHDKDHDKVKQIYGTLLDNPNLTIPPDLQARIRTVMTKLDRKPAPLPPPEKKADVSAVVGSQNKYLVSAIVSTYNAEDFLTGCLDDLERQTIADRLEIIVVNSGSQQDEETIVRRYQQKYHNIVYIKTEQREGIYSAWNRAVKVARGRFLTNANTDDRHRQDALEIMAKTLQANPEVALVYGDQIRTDTPNDTFANHHGIEELRRPDYTRERLLLGCCVGSQPMWRKSLHDEFGYFDETLDCAGDWDFWIRISSKYKFRRIPEFLGLYYYNQEGIEHGSRIHSLYERYVVGRRYGTEYIAVIPYCKPRPDDPLVSVVMPVYNGAEFIGEAIESVLIQSYPRFELIIVDDGSTDATRDVVAAFEDERIKYIYKENNGPSSARNRAIKEATGEYIMPLDADDMMTPDFIVTHLQHFRSNPDADLVYCDVLLIDSAGKPIRVMKKPEYQDRGFMVRDLFKAGHPIIPFRLGIRKSVFDKIGLYDETLIVAEDYDMIRRFVKAGLNARHLPEPLHLRRMHHDSLCGSTNCEKIRNHFDVIRRFIETFAPDELFPDVAWDRIPPTVRPLHVKCRAAVILLEIGRAYLQANARDYARTAFTDACSELKECLSMDPANQRIRQMLQKCERVRAEYENAELQSVR
ncbi:MAG TPA: glycosyltransferase [Sedimentisphaerales bacterium]|nr:glycosyltransferase [Sedimentisphaerales bacterium]